VATSTEFSAGGVVVRGDETIVIVPRRRAANGRAVVALPKGHVDPGETPPQAAVREVREEVGLEIGALRYVESHTFVGNEGNQVVDIVFLTRYAGGEPIITDPGEVAAIEWMSTAEVLADPRCPPWIEESLRRVDAGRGEDTHRRP